MIGGAHMIVSAHDPEAARAFAHDVLGFRAVDACGGWLVFELPRRSWPSTRVRVGAAMSST